MTKSPIVNMRGEAIESPEPPPSAMPDILLQFDRAIENKVARGQMMMRLAKLMTGISILPSDPFRKLLEVDKEEEFEKELAANDTMPPDMKEDVRLKRLLARRCIQAFLKIKPEVDKAMLDAGIDASMVNS